MQKTRSLIIRLNPETQICEVSSQKFKIKFQKMVKKSIF